MHLTFAKNELEFDVPQSGIFKSDKDREYHYIIKYFDRLNDYKFQRKEFATYMGLNSSNKYNKEKTTLEIVMMNAYQKRVEVLNKNGWIDNINTI